VVATAALGHVVEQRGHVEHPGLVPARGQLRAERVRLLGSYPAANARGS
jgi:hypothetical protein